MSPNEIFDEMVAGLGELLGREFTRDDDGTWMLELAAGRVTVCLSFRRESGQALAFARIGELPECEPAFAEARARALLQANAFWKETGGFTLGLDPETRQLVAVDRRGLAELPSEEHLASWVDALVELVEGVRSDLGRFSDMAEIEAEGGLAEEEALA